VRTMKAEVFENDDTFSHVLHIVQIDIFCYTNMCQLQYVLFTWITSLEI